MQLIKDTEQDSIAGRHTAGGIGCHPGAIILWAHGCDRLPVCMTHSDGDSLMGNRHVMVKDIHVCIYLHAGVALLLHASQHMAAAIALVLAQLDCST